MSRFSLLSGYYHSFIRAKRRLIEKANKTMGLRPTLDYVEFHLADHCNLNCRGCGHFSPIADKQLASLDEYQRDIRQLAKLFANIKIIVLMGGEPLLNPQISEFMYVTRSSFPKAIIQIFTNGILLPEMPQTFWDVCKACSVTIDISLYPPLFEKEQSLVNLVKANQLKLQIHRVYSFQAFYNEKGDTLAQKAFKKCRLRWYTPILREGRIHICPKAATIHYFNRKFDLKIPRTGSTNIHSPNLSGWDIKERLNKASSTCKYCTLGWDTIPAFPWKISKRILADWEQ